jgi:hypothetical protein
MIKLVDSGSGAYICASHIIELAPHLKNKIEIIKTPCHVGRLNNHSLISLFTDLIKEHKLKINKGKYEGVYLACNTLNSFFRKYKGAYDHLLKFLDDHKKDRILIVCTPNTKKQFNKYESWKYNNVEVMSLSHEVVQRIDSGKLVNIELKTDMFKYLVLGCTHYDLINFNTNMEVISTSKLLAEHIINDYKKGD